MESSIGNSFPHLTFTTNFNNISISFKFYCRGLFSTRRLVKELMLMHSPWSLLLLPFPWSRSTTDLYLKRPSPVTIEWASLYRCKAQANKTAITHFPPISLCKYFDNKEKFVQEMGKVFIYFSCLIHQLTKSEPPPPLYHQLSLSPFQSNASSLEVC